ncbi:MAG: N-acetylmuramoyl-L-alanine amidase [Pseudomonadota bacterium]
MEIADHPSPNFGPRRDGARPELVVLHYTAMEAAAARARLCAPEHKVSAHYLIDPDGAIWRLVDEDRRAWHAGAGTWRGRGDVNSRSIGIELANSGATPFAAPQMRALEALLRDILARWAMPAQAVIGHADLAPDRKQDPGPRFDWRGLARQRLAVWPAAHAPAQAAPAAFAAAAARFGYDPASAQVLRAFRHRFRPWAVGSLDGWDVAAAQDLARRFGGD